MLALPTALQLTNFLVHTQVLVCTPIIKVLPPKQAHKFGSWCMEYIISQYNLTLLSMKFIHIELLHCHLIVLQLLSSKQHSMVLLLKDTPLTMVVNH